MLGMLAKISLYCKFKIFQLCCESIIISYLYNTHKIQFFYSITVHKYYENEKSLWQALRALWNREKQKSTLTL